MKNLFNGKGILAGALGGVVSSLLQDVGEELKKDGANYVKANLFGLGKDDEHLFLTACSYAIYWRLASKEGVAKVRRAIAIFPELERKNIIRVIGHGEDKLIVPEGVADDKVRAADGNVNGAYIIGYLAQYGQREIMKILETSGASKSQIYEALKTAKPVVSNLKRELDEFLEAPSSFEKWLSEL